MREWLRYYGPSIALVLMLMVVVLVCFAVIAGNPSDDFDIVRVFG